MSAELVLWLYFLPNFYKETLNVLLCKEIGTNSYVSADYNQLCSDVEHYLYSLFVAIPCLIFFVFFIPVDLYINIYNDIYGKKTLTPLQKYRYYYINGEFRNKFFYWEFYRLAEKLIIMTVIAGFESNVPLMSELCLLTVLVYGISSFYANPYIFPE